MKKEDILVIDAEAEDYKEAIECAGNCLFKEGYVKDNFVEECLKREQIYPTGLPSATPIAIPHCASKFGESFKKRYGVTPTEYRLQFRDRNGIIELNQNI